MLALARVRCIGSGLYCIALAVVGFVPAFVAMVLGKVLLAFGDLWADECDRAMKRSNEARSRLLEMEADR